MNQLQSGEKFSFVEEAVEAIHLRTPFGGGSLGYHLPAEWVRSMYKPELLSDSVTLRGTDVLQVEKAYQSVSGWCIVAIWNNYDIHFLQKDMDVKQLS